MSELVVITDPGEEVEEEYETIRELIERGVTRLHVRKPGWSSDKLSKWLEGLGEDSFDHLSLHGDEYLCKEYGLGGFHLKGDQPIKGNKWMGRLSKSFHAWSELKTGANERLDYAFISPVFDSISKRGYFAKWGAKEVKEELGNSTLPFPLYALGGISKETIGKVKDLGFDGAVALGSVWKYPSRKERVHAFKQLKEKWKQEY